MRQTAATSEQASSFLSLIGHPQRWRLVEELARSDRRVNELVDAVDAPSNLVSYHLRKLRQGELVHERRSSADARDVYYALDLDRLRQLYSETARSLHPGLMEPEGPQPEGSRRRDRAVRVLFLCTHNSARSQMAEGILRHLGGERFEVFSAGSQPSRVHPLAIRVMAKRQIDISGQKSKHMATFADETFDYVITVCDLASEVCPVFPGAERIHWSIPDPSAVEGAEREKAAAFEHAGNDLLTRIRYLVSLAGRKAKRPSHPPR